MPTPFINAAPMTNFRGIDDDSQRTVPTEPEVVPQHLPHVLFYAKKGPLDPQLVIGNSRIQLYGADSFDERKKWANHATVLSNQFNADANAQMAQRVKPLDAGPNASMRLWADVLPTQVQDYVRNEDGSYATTSQGVKIPTAEKINGFLIKYVLEQIGTDEEGEDTFGRATQKAGNQTDSGNATQSVRYPIMDLRVPFFGADGNNNGLSIWAPTTKSVNALDARILQNELVYPFRMACVTRPDEKTTGTLVATRANEQFIEVSFKPGSINRNSDKQMYVNDVFFNVDYGYQNLAAQPPVYGQFGEIHVYDDNVKNLLDDFYAAEFAANSEFSDFTGAADEQYLFNMIGATTSGGVPYHSVQIVSGVSDSVRLTESSKLYATGGSDGTMNDALFAALVEAEMDKYADENSHLQNDAKYPQSAVWDSGFPIATKKKLCQALARVSKDVYVVLSTTVAGEPPLTASEDSARALMLKTFAQNYPESEYYGTKTCRAVIVGRSGILVNSRWTKRLPMTFDLAHMVSLYMGAGDGRWKSGFSFDDPANNKVTLFRDISVGFTPVLTRNKDWANGMNWVEDFDRRSAYWPAVKTVYDNDTSVLTGFMTMAACVELEKVGARARRQYSGNQSLTDAQYAERIDQYTIENTTGRFDGKYTIESITTFTAQDVARGYSYTQEIDIYAPNMRTVGTLSIVAKRLSDLQQ